MLYLPRCFTSIFRILMQCDDQFALLLIPECNHAMSKSMGQNCINSRFRHFRRLFTRTNNVQWWLERAAFRESIEYKRNRRKLNGSFTPGISLLRNTTLIIEILSCQAVNRFCWTVLTSAFGEFTAWVQITVIMHIKPLALLKSTHARTVFEKYKKRRKLHPAVITIC